MVDAGEPRVSGGVRGSASTAGYDDALFADRFRAAREGDSEARTWLVQRYTSDLEAYVSSRMGAAARAKATPDDVVQEAVMTFLGRLPRFPAELGESDVRARLFKIASWTIADLFKRRPLQPLPSASRAEPSASAVSRGTVTRADDSRQLQELIGRMREDYADVVRCCVLEGLSFESAAARLGISEANARKRLFRARAELSSMSLAWRKQEGV